MLSQQEFLFSLTFKLKYLTFKKFWNHPAWKPYKYTQSVKFTFQLSEIITNSFLKEKQITFSFASLISLI